MRVLRALLCAMALISCATAAQAQRYPDRPIRIIVPFGPGGATDIIARVIAQPLGEKLGQSVIVENRPGAGSNLGAGVVAKSEPDGYTFLLATSAIIASPALHKNLAYDITRDLVPVAELVGTPNVIVSKPGAGFDSIADMVRRAKANPEKVNYGSPGVGTTPQLAFELLKLRAGVSIQHVPFPGGAASSQSILSDSIELGTMSLANVHGQVKGGTLKGVAVSGTKRWHDLPDVPTLQEAGFPEFDFETIFHMMAPAGTPRDIIDRVSRETIAILNRPEIVQRVRGAGYDVLGKGPDVLAARIAKEMPVYRDIVAKAGIPTF